MAELTCPWCGQPLAAGETLCPVCILPVPTQAKTTQANTVQGDAAPSGVAPSAPDTHGCTDPDCVHAGRVPAGGCRDCGRGKSAPASLRFRRGDDPDWDEAVPGTGEALYVGRVDSPMAARLAGFLNISRRHAEIRNENGSLMITDLNSANGTYVNGIRISPGQAQALRHGDQVRFASDLHADVDLGGEAC